MKENRMNRSEVNIRIISALNIITIEEIQENSKTVSIKEILFELKEIKSKSEFKKYLNWRSGNDKKLEQLNFLKDIVEAITLIFKARPISKTAEQKHAEWLQKEADDDWYYHTD